jgi:aspartyl-tRNA(Asn)/glutamyl-tRNA(Gln) amidotransferase subunit C
MSFNTTDIKKIAHLARLGVNDSQAKALSQEFTTILELVDTMSQVDTDQVEPLSHPFDAKQPLRKDIVTETNQREKLQANAPDIKAGLYIVPQFVETE